MRLILEVKNPTEKVWKYILYQLSSGIFRCAQYDVLFLYVILNGSEESHRITDGHILFALVVGYFAYAQYDVLFLYVILNAVKNPTEELTIHIHLT